MLFKENVVLLGFATDIPAKLVLAQYSFYTHHQRYDILPLDTAEEISEWSSRHGRLPVLHASKNVCMKRSRYVFRANQRHRVLSINCQKLGNYNTLPTL
jgi:hypothetical protein